MEMVKKIGILGAGKLGMVLGQLASRAGYQVYIAGSGSPEKIALTVEVLLPGAKALIAKEVVEKTDTVILALPLGKYQTLSIDQLADKLVIDAMNYWWEVDGQRPELTDVSSSSSELVQSYLKKSIVVKAFNHMGYHNLYDEAKSKGQRTRKAIAIVGDNKDAVQKVAAIVDDFGFDPLDGGNLSQGIRMEPGSPVFGANLEYDELKAALASFETTKRGIEAKKAGNLAMK
ncbi:NADPH-dependent F420 reductase [Liquorilactobacillus mali]|nr:NAD(P)-binding domain-containing protein [Liquorilactobacillus mali]